MVEVACPSIEAFVKSSANIRRIFSILKPPDPDLSWGNRTITLRDSLALHPWHLRVDLGTEDHYSTSVIKHLHHSKG